MSNLSKNKKKIKHKFLLNTKKYKVAFNGGNITSDSGLILLEELLEKSGFNHLMESIIAPLDSLFFKRTPKYDSVHFLKQKILQILMGYKNDSDANSLQFDPLFQEVLEMKPASQSTLSRFFARFSKLTKKPIFSALNKVNYTFLKPLFEEQSQFILDIDSTYAETFGHQTGSDFNTHYRNVGYHPLVAYEATSHLMLGVQYRSGNAYTSTDSKEFIEDIYKNLIKKLPHLEQIIIRGDSGFHKPELFSYFEEIGFDYTIRLKNNNRLQTIAQDLYENYQKEDQVSSKETLTHYESFPYRADSWDKARRVVFELKYQNDELLPKATCIVTNLEEGVSDEEIFDFYRNRGLMENFIQESKEQFFLDKVSHHTIEENQFHALISMLAYNVYGYGRIKLLPHLHERRLKRRKQKKDGSYQDSYTTATVMSMGTFRVKFLKIGGKVTHHSRETQLALSSSYPHKEDFLKLIIALMAL